jgi:D-alanine-D-alanine ligase
MKILILAPDTSVPVSSLYPSDPYSKWEDDTVKCVGEALKRLGHEMETLECSLGLLDNLKSRAGVDLVFNLCDDGFQNRMFTEPLVAGIIELSDVHFTGAGFESLTLCQNKRISKDIMRSNRIRTPKYFYAETGKGLGKAKLDGRFILKPNLMDGSMGISMSSVISSKQELEERGQKMIADYGPLLIEEFIGGREFSVAMVGDRVLPVVEVKAANALNIKTSEAKWDAGSEDFRKLRMEFPELGSSMRNRLARACRKAKTIFRMEDFMRFDFRVSEDETAYLIDLNPNCALCSDATLVEIYKHMGKTYDDMIGDILKSAMKRKKVQ